MLDYRNMMDLMFIANQEIWFNPDNVDKYENDAIRASEDTWDRFWELVDLNGGKNEISEYLSDTILNGMSQRKTGGNWWSDNIEAYPDWYENISELLYENGYPITIEYPIIPDTVLAKSAEYINVTNEATALLSELEKQYIV